MQLPKHVIRLFYSPECAHCRTVLDEVAEYLRTHPEIELEKIDATTRENTDHLEALLKGDLSVPATLIDDVYIVKGDANFTQRLTYALQLAETTPTPKEVEQQWLLRK